MTHAAAYDDQVPDRGPDGRSAVPILLYHDVTDEPRDQYGLTPRAFARHMRQVEQSCRTPMTVDEYVDARSGSGGRQMPHHPVLVTFDDGHDDFVLAVDAMLAAGIAASTVYVTTRRVDRPGGIARRLLAALPNRVQVGAHSRTHPQLDLLPDTHLQEEIRGAKDDLEQWLGRPCASFAYPHGIHGARVRRATIDAGFRSAAAVKNALTHADDDIFALARVTITQHTTDEQVAALLEGRGAPLSWPGERLRTKAFRAYRRLAARRVHHG